jgi:hypothetical protein
MTLGDHVRVVRTFLEAFKAAAEDHPDDEEKTAAETAELAQLRIDLRVDPTCSPCSFFF